MAIKQVNEEKRFKVYMHTAPNGKRYIGITSMPLWKRWGNGKGYKRCTLFYRAIEKYGWENFQHEILYEDLSKEEACEKEQELISLYKCNDSEFGYNLASGGEINFFEHHKASQETKKKISEGIKKHFREHPRTPEEKARVAENIMRNKKPHIYTDEERKRMSEMRKGKPNYKIRGRKLPEWQRKFIGDINRGANNAKARKVICLDTLKVYDTIREGAKDTGSDYRAIGNVCKNKKIKTNSLHWAYYDETKDDNYYTHLLKVKMSIERPPMEKKVICVETNEVFDSMRKAADNYGLFVSCIFHSCNNPFKTSGGYHWRYADVEVDYGR